MCCVNDCSFNGELSIAQKGSARGSYIWNKVYPKEHVKVVFFFNGLGDVENHRSEANELSEGCLD